MKSTFALPASIQAFSCALLASAFTASMHAQLWLEKISDTDVTFVVKANLDNSGAGSVAGAFNTALTPDGYNVNKNVTDSGAGLRVNFAFTNNRTLDVTITNLSSGTYFVDPTGPTAGANVSFNKGVLTSFGFSVNPHSLTISSFTKISSNDATVAFTQADPFTVHIPLYSTDLGAKASDVTNGLAEGKYATFRFVFGATGFSQGIFNPYDFFGATGTNMDFTAIFNNTNSGSGTPEGDYNGSTVNWDKVGIRDDFFTYYRPTPEPSTYGILGAVGLLGLIYLRKRTKK